VTAKCRLQDFLPGDQTLQLPPVKDFSLLFFLLHELEKTPAPISSEDLDTLIRRSGLVPKDKRTLQRVLAEFRQRKISLENPRRRYRLVSSGSNTPGILAFLRDMFLSKIFAPVFYGDLDVRRGKAYFAERDDLVRLYYPLVTAIREEKVVNFDYLPYAHTTLNAMGSNPKAESKPQKMRTLRVLPRYLVASGNSFLVLGEYFERKSFNRNDFRPAECRHYELRGVTNVVVGDAQKPALDINPHELYRDSVHIWVGGEEHQIEIEELWLGDYKVRRKKLKVNGEDEILSLVASSLGRMRIINPPQELIDRADDIGLPRELMFRMDKSEI
jgi:hypothetical protein